MKFFHLSDLHIGKQLHHYNLREDQEHILAEVLSYAESIHPDAIVIAGDIYDKSVPSAEAVSLFDEFLTALAKIEPVIPVLIISGNHDSAQRLDYASRLLGSHQIYIAGQAPEEEADKSLFPVDCKGTGSCRLQFHLQVFYRSLHKLPLSLPPRDQLFGIPRQACRGNHIP